jgi:hypothetical protein
MIDNEQLVNRLVEYAQELGGVSVEARNTRNLVRELKWNLKTQPNGRPWKKKARVYRAELLAYNRKLSREMTFLRRMILASKSRLTA